MALFAFQSPLSKGALLADKVSLDKTIETGMVISQKYAELKREVSNKALRNEVCRGAEQTI